MDNFFKTFRENLLLSGIAYGILGILILIKPEPFFNVIVYIFAAFFGIMGVINLINNYRAQKRGYSGSQLTTGILLLVAAFLILIFAKALVSIIPIFLGVFILISGITQLVQELQLKKENAARTGWFVFSILLIIAGALLLFNPFRSVLLVFQIFGGLLVILGISRLMDFFRLRNV
ncbi:MULTISPECIES: HdeD family acid-resistance protein [Enterococcus]|jgi:uncharacterized membrane protein HdeD (DUF308 family)|uniref:Acid-resistance membrane protein n=2 Tax=Enterococcus dispar TaxID=44009 RepID=S0KT68_9ENTE|nr:DUF308 domain-containing protein [Enterococcus dispar]EOT43323.1 hypothetical protein OMK_00678 [Enterococcus dispar ATCC 51266]EOW85229.1 hypothetical protein I569_00522 [Enterococcus dispar ATCC 51266]MCU7358439.1 DUF308 domain-containing protein [Enterococcus dispar]MDT2706599.1 DUF308 domain-containing protein [Enterococcus dispar]OJG40123.1 hypothetical protein RV01_GL000197 [Enterococcus dispar]